MKKEEQVMKGFRDILNKIVLLNKPKMEKNLEGYTSSEVHCIEYIGKTPDSNVTELAESFYMTRGAISKLTKKLMSKGLIESYQSPDNKKEIYFRLTEQGKTVYNIHEKLHKEFVKRDEVIFEQISEEQFDSMISFINKYTEHLDAEMKKQNINAKSK
ncbi:MarR family winged helix-turn-helix transcriptional regulator [Sebaldella sp. S0638]|uniref:MarR family winged helix-turn-helix transcriptional regulator n=1 Tax=Sebaldella sp. S0638 TaxID=2957809 RepID=UPI0020A1FC09|nr:MarR family transcriptional regulator [Sebaldella sp. S0638]MCP1224109.1 MarR family transcriptional regulator [Sebaldella sp. S0638]